MTKIIIKILFITFLFNTSLFAQSNGKIRSLQKELNIIKKNYEKRISNLEASLKKETNSNKSAKKNNRKIYGNAFNPSIGMVLNGQYATFSEGEAEIAGFQVGEEGEKGKEGFSIGESELNFSSNVDDKFYASFTAAIVNEDGSDKLELEEAYVQTLPNKALVNGLSAKFGRALWTLGYLNSHHAHSDDFADRPLPYRVYLNKGFNDDGIQVSYLLPIDFYVELGAGIFRGDDFPLGGGGDKSSYSSFIKFAGDIGAKQSWQLGAAMLSGQPKGTNGRKTGEADEGYTYFKGDSDLYIADFRYIFAPTANNRDQELILQGEYFYRNEDGGYSESQNSGFSSFDDSTQGWYVQGVYKFNPTIRLGLRYSKMNAAYDSVINKAENRHDPEVYSVMTDWTNSEFSRFRLQYNREELADNKEDKQFIVQYIMSFGAHAAHKY